MPRVASIDVDPATGDFHWAPFRREAGEKAATCPYKDTWMTEWKAVISEKYTRRENGLDRYLIEMDAQLAYSQRNGSVLDDVTALAYQLGGTIFYNQNGHWMRYQQFCLPLFASRLSFPHMEQLSEACKQQFTEEEWQEGEHAEFSPEFWSGFDSSKDPYARCFLSIREWTQGYHGTLRSNISAAFNRLGADAESIIASFYSDAKAFAPARPIPSNAALLQRLLQSANRDVQEKEFTVKLSMEQVAEKESELASEREQLSEDRASLAQAEQERDRIQQLQREATARSRDASSVEPSAKRARAS